MGINYNKLRGRIVEKYGSATAFADAVGLTKQTVSCKLVGKIGFSQKDIATWCESLDIPAEEIPLFFFDEG